jgi:hypothetical protein
MLPTRRLATPLDFALGGVATLLHCGMLTTPYNPSWLLFRRAIAFPLILGFYGWLFYVPIHPIREDQWGIGFLLRALQKPYLGLISSRIRHAPG